MLKKLIIIGIIGLQANFAFATNHDQLGLAGKYICYGYDKHDGGYQNAIVTLGLDAKNSDFANNYGAYSVKLVEQDGSTYTGEAAANGNHLAIYFENTDPKMKTDRGVGIAIVTHDKDPKGKITTVFHKFYYEPEYQKGGNGYETCTKQ